MIKKFLKTLLFTLSIFFLIILLSFVSIFVKKTCSEDNTCPENYLCNTNKKVCVESEKCSGEKPEVCITLYDPVCSDGKEYSNGCFACMAGVKSYYKGPC